MLHKKGGAFVSNETQFVIVPPFETEAEPISFCSTCAESELAATLGWSINLLVFMQHTSLFLSSQNDPPHPHYSTALIPTPYLRSSPALRNPQAGAKADAEGV